MTFTPTNGADTNNATDSIAINVQKATPVITWSNPADIPSGTALSATQLDATANVAGTFSYTLANGVTPALGAVLGVGQGQTLEITFTPTDTADYNSAPDSVAINVLSATPTLTWSNPPDISYGTPLGAGQLNATANVAGTFSYTLADDGTTASRGNPPCRHESNPSC